jgi:hypothetical protein
MNEKTTGNTQRRRLAPDRSPSQRFRQIGPQSEKSSSAQTRVNCLRVVATHCAGSSAISSKKSLSTSSSTANRPENKLASPTTTSGPAGRARKLKVSLASQGLKPGDRLPDNDELSEFAEFGRNGEADERSRS